MDPEEKNHYKFIYTRNTPFSFRFFGIFVVLVMFAAIPVVVMSINQQTNSSSHAAVLSAGITPTATPTIRLTQATTQTITPIPTAPPLTPTAAPTHVPGSAYASISLISPAISTNGGNTQPGHPTRLVTITLYDVATQHSYTAQDTLTFDGVQSFTNPHFDLGMIPSGTYQLLAAMPGNLEKILTQTNNTNTFQITLGGTIAVPAARLIAGDIGPIPGTNNQPYGDNVLDIEDYNVLIGCYSETHSAMACSNVGQTAADLNDDGKVDAVDYNILLRSFATRDGDSLPIQSAISGTVTPSMTLSMAPTATPTIPTGVTVTITPMPAATATSMPTATIVPINNIAPTVTTAASNVICSSSSNQQCSFGPSCSTSGISCQCADKNWSGHDKVYTCQSGSWHYVNDTTQTSQYICTSPCGAY